MVQRLEEEVPAARAALEKCVAKHAKSKQARIDATEKAKKDLAAAKEAQLQAEVEKASTHGTHTAMTAALKMLQQQSEVRSLEVRQAEQSRNTLQKSEDAVALEFA